MKIQKSNAEKVNFFDSRWGEGVKANVQATSMGNVSREDVLDPFVHQRVAILFGETEI